MLGGPYSTRSSPGRRVALWTSSLWRRPTSASMFLLAAVGWALVFLAVWQPHRGDVQKQLVFAPSRKERETPQPATEEASQAAATNNWEPVVEKIPTTPPDEEEEEEEEEEEGLERRVRPVDPSGYDEDGFLVVERAVDASAVKNKNPEWSRLLLAAKDPCAAKAECARRACGAFAWAPAERRVVWVSAERSRGDPSWPRGELRLFVFLRRELPNATMALEASLRVWDDPRGGYVQTSSTAWTIGVLAGWKPLGGPPTKLALAPTLASSGVEFDAFAMSHEAWVDGSRKLGGEIFGGLCEATDRCARDPECEALSYRARDGVATLYARLALRDEAAVKNRLVAQRPKARRSIWLYAKRKTTSTRRDLREQLDQPPSSSSSSSSSSSGAQYYARCVHRHSSEWYAAARQTGALVERAPSSVLPLSSRTSARLVVTLTTLPGRVGQTRPVIDSLLDQTRPPDEIRLHVPRAVARTGDRYALPAWLDEIDKLEVRRLDKDYGPATKLIPAVQEWAGRDDVLLVAVDDDTLYPPRLLETLEEWATRLPDSAVSATGWPVKSDFTYPHWTENNLVYGNELWAPHPVAVVRGNCGFAVRPSFFTPNLWTEMAAAPKGATLMDDVWISGHLARNGVPRFVVPFDPDQFTRSPEFTGVRTLDADLGARDNKKARGAPLDRKTANEASLAYFKSEWDVVWSPPNPTVRRRRRRDGASSSRRYYW